MFHVRMAAGPGFCLLMCTHRRSSFLSLGPLLSLLQTTSNEGTRWSAHLNLLVRSNKQADCLQDVLHSNYFVLVFFLLCFLQDRVKHCDHLKKKRITTSIFHETNVSGNRRSHGKMMSKCIQCCMYVRLQVQASACWCALTDGPRSFLWALCCPCYKLHRMKAHDDLPNWIYLSGQTNRQTACRMCSILTTSSSFSSFCASSKTESSNATIWENRISTVIFHETSVPENRRFHFASWYAHNCTHRRAANDLPTLCCMSVRTKLRNDAPTACRLCSMLTRPSSLSSFSASS